MTFIALHVLRWKEVVLVMWFVWAEGGWRSCVAFEVGSCRSMIYMHLGGRLSAGVESAGVA